jgi:hypothetical protein
VVGDHAMAGGAGKPTMARSALLRVLIGGPGNDRPVGTKQAKPNGQERPEVEGDPGRAGPGELEGRATDRGRGQRPRGNRGHRSPQPARAQAAPRFDWRTRLPTDEGTSRASVPSRASWFPRHDGTRPARAEAVVLSRELSARGQPVDVDLLTHVLAFGTPVAINLANAEGAPLDLVDARLVQQTEGRCTFSIAHSRAPS